IKTLISAMMILVLLSAPGCTAPPAPGKAAEPSPTPVVTEAPAENRDVLAEKAVSMLEEMTVEEKVGQLLVVGFPEDISSASLQEYFYKYKVSGFILFSRNFKDFRSMYSLVGELKEKNSLSGSIPLFISIDEEGGKVSRLPQGGTHFPDPAKLGKANDPTLTFKSGKVIGQELAAAGINIDFAPVLDIVTDSGNKLLIRRSYGSTKELVSAHGTAFIKGLQSTGVIAVPKHFPGHGNTTVDSHTGLPVIDTDRNAFEARELFPFKAAIQEGVDIIMVGHIAFPKLDPSGLPATMSEYVLKDVLRNQLDFKGVAISDDIEMKGYTSAKGSIEEGVVASFNSGLDVFLIGHTKDTQVKVFDALKGAVADGRISEERLNEAVLRILKVKLKHELRDTMDYSSEEAEDIFGSEEHRAVLEEVNKAVK
ncbi:MAG TPA: beta-N-acetylhexosaminidase, partial [Negativicutes bacterium]|nr:beta-N-acetylhexosaminidase [Negativicutes bacterium]